MYMIGALDGGCIYVCSGPRLRGRQAPPVVYIYRQSVIATPFHQAGWGRALLHRFDFFHNVISQCDKLIKGVDT